MKLERTDFLHRLGLLYSECENASVFVTFKRLSYKKEGAVEFPCLVRATAKNTKISTVVDPEDLESFNDAYFNIVKLSMTSLKKKERVKRKRVKKNATEAMQVDAK